MTEKKDLTKENEIDYKTQLEIVYMIVNMITRKRLFGVKKVLLEEILEECKENNPLLKNEDIITVSESIPFCKISDKNGFFIGLSVDL